jgi:hypothetical protein
VESRLPALFWSRVTNKLGNSFYIREHGASAALQNAVEAMSYCLQQSSQQSSQQQRDPAAARECSDVPFAL